MKSHRNLALAIAFLALGCAHDRPVIVESSSSSPHNPSGNAIEAIKAYSFEQRDLAVTNLESVINDLDGRIQDFRARSKSIASNRREDWNETLTKLELKRDELEVLTTRMKFATIDKWDETKKSAVNGLEEVQDYLQKLQKTVQD
ncbi:MAG TPA: hypothetical protein VFD71_08210 [Planctomycetota bacterium]|nr:hypothetical protein [Planctomycetota bacterium]